MAPQAAASPLVRFARPACWAVFAVGAVVVVAGWTAELDLKLDVVAQFAAPTAATTFAGAVVALGFRLVRPALACAVATAALVVALAPQWFPPVGPADPQAGSARVYFANLMQGNTDYGRIARSVKAADPDVIAFVELDMRSYERLAALLPEYPYRTSGPLRGREARETGGAVVFSKTPVQRIDFDFRTTRGPAREAYWAQHRAENADSGFIAFLDTVTDTPAGPLRVVAVHGAKGWPARAEDRQMKQVRRMARELARTPLGRTVVVGDFNATPTSRPLRTLARETGLRPVSARTGTWPSDAPPFLRLAIDNAFVGPGLAVERRGLGRPTGSNHAPIVLDVAPAATVAR